MKQRYKLFSILMIVGLLFTPCIVSAEPENVTPDPTPSVSPTPDPIPEPTPEPSIETTLKLDKTEAKIDAGKTLTLIATVTQSDAVIEWQSSDESIATVDQNGVVTANKDKAGEAVIIATIKGSSIKDECKITVLRNIGKDATLKTLTIENGKLDQPFKSDVFKYKVEVNSAVNSLIFINVETNDPYAGDPLITKNDKINNGDIVKVIVIAEDGTTSKTYEFEVVKGAPSVALKSLKINGYALNEVFKTDNLKYTADIPYEIDTLTIEAEPVGDDAKTIISGNNNLKVGKNTVTVLVKDTNGNTRTYEIIVTRSDKVTIDENPTSIITSSDTDSDNIVPDNTNNNSNTKKNNGSDDFLKYVVVSLACLILFAIGGIGIYFYIKTSPKKLRKELDSNKVTSEELPITVVDDNNLSNINEIINEDLFATREYKKEELSDKDKPLENLFDDNSEDVK